MSKFKLSFVFLVLIVAALSLGSAIAAVSTDKSDYVPGDTVAITGDGMNAGDTVSVDVTDPDGVAVQHHEVLAQADGTFSDSYAMPADGKLGVYTVTAADQSGNVFGTTFDPRPPTPTEPPTSTPTLQPTPADTPTSTPTPSPQTVSWTGNGTTDGACSSFENDPDLNPAAGQQGWLFILTSPYDGSGSVLNATFSDGPQGPIAGTYKGGGVGSYHYAVYTTAGAILSDANATNGTLQSNLTVSHCESGGGGPLGITTEIHNSDHVGILEAKAGDVIHDSAAITGSIPIGSVVHTDLFPGKDCTDPPIAAGSSGSVVFPDPPAAASVDPSTPGYSVTPGDALAGLSYHAQVLDSSGVVLADSDCEPLSVTAEAEPPTVSKDASGSYDDTFNWTITKDVDKTIVKQFGGTATFTYTVSVSHGDSQVSNVEVAGTITVSNPNSVDVTLDSITDKLDGTTCSVDTSGGLTIGTGDTEFPYECDLDDSLPLIEVYNKVTATWSEQTLSDGSHLDAGSADFTTDPVSFTANEIDECVTVVDDNATPGDTSDDVALGTVCVGDDNPTTFAFSRTYPVPQWDCVSYTNTATFTTNDTGTTGSASQTVTVCGPAKTGALTMGFWQNKNGQGIITGGSSTGGVCNSGTWLRQYNPFKDLSATATCAQVATYVTNVIKAANASGTSMNAMLKAQMLATALDVYFSDPALGGNKINAPAPIGGVKIDVTLICTDLTCTAFEDASSVFPSNSGGKESVLGLLTDASNASNANGIIWYGNVKSTQELAKDTFDALNNQKVFDP
jgi:hypothetical protein